MLHPFREGNGRTIRMYIYVYALVRGIEWQYETMDRKRYIEAMIQSVVDLKMLRQVFLETIQYKC